MWVNIYREAGYEEAARAARLSRQSVDRSDTVGDELGFADSELFKALLQADKDASGDPHAVGLRQIVFWIGVRAPLYWWKHMDRYSVGKDQASDSTMYNLMCRPLTKFDFQCTIPTLLLWWLNYNIKRNNFKVVNACLPLSYLQERALMVSLPTLRRIIRQRSGHKLSEWNIFISEIKAQARYPNLL